jgi:S1-C subfamily serine protease
MNRSKLTAALCAVIMSSVLAFGQQERQPARTPAELSAREIARIGLPAVVVVLCDDSDVDGVTQGSGFFVRPGILITNYHVIEDSSRGVIRVGGSNDQQWTFRIASVIAYDEASDLAVLSVPSAAKAGVPTLDLAPVADSIDVGETIYALGNPQGLVGTISPGIVSAALKLTDNKSRLQITAPLSRGSSGGPVVDVYGNVIGVAASTLSKGQNLNFAVPAALVKKLLDSVGSGSETLNADYASSTDTVPPAKWAWPAAKTSQPASAVQRRVAVGPPKPGESPQVASLRKLGGVHVVIGDLDENGDRLFNKDKLQAEIETRLKQKGVTVLSMDEWLASAGSPALSLKVGLATGKTSTTYAYSIALELQQNARLGRDDSTFLSNVTTWNRNSVGITTRVGAPAKVSASIAQLVDAFCSDYLKSNSP